MLRSIVSLIVLPTLVLSNIASSNPCPDNMREICLDCDEAGACIKCKPGYFKYKSSCSKCLHQCIECDQADKCIQCSPDHFRTSHGQCSRCSKNCLTCLDDAHFCTSCSVGYKLDNRKTCHYKFALILFLLALGFVLLIIAVIILLAKRCCTSSANQVAQPKYDSVLDRETLAQIHKKTVLTHVEEIGRDCEENDISVVGVHRGGSTLKSFLARDNEEQEGPEDILKQLTDSTSAEVKPKVFTRRTKK